MNLFDELMALVAELDAHGVDYALIGGLAVAVWGVPRATKDIDLLILPEAIERAKEAASRRGFVLAAGPLKFRDGVSIERVSRVRDGALLTVDFMLVSEGLTAAWASRTQLRTVERTLSVVSRDALIAMKIAAARPQDIADVEKLRDLDR
jgi:hypothetical protein